MCPIVPRICGDHVVDSKLWLKNPPGPALPWDYLQRRYCEHDQVGNNLNLYMEDIALMPQLRKESSKELSIVGPLALCAETSICWDQYTSLFAASKSVSAAVTANIFSLSLQGYMQEVSIILQIVNLYSKALSSKSNTESIGISGRGDTVSKTEGSVPSPENKRKTDLEYNPSLVRADGASFTLCVRTFSAELEKIRLVLGDSRKEEGHSATRKRSAKASTDVKKDLGMRHDSREGKAYFMNRENYHDGNDSGNQDAFTWDHIPPGPSLDKEASILGKDALIHISLGDDQQFCTFMGMKDFLLRLVDSGSMNSANDLSECEISFSTHRLVTERVPSHLSGQKSFSGFQFFPKHRWNVSFKVFGPKSQEDEGHTNDFPHHSRVASPDAFKTKVDPLDEDLHDGEAMKELELFQLSTQSLGINFGDNVQPSDVRNSITSPVRSTSRQQLHREDEGSSQGQHTRTQRFVPTDFMMRAEETAGNNSKNSKVCFNGTASLL